MLMTASLYARCMRAIVCDSLRVRSPRSFFCLFVCCCFGVVRLPCCPCSSVALRPFYPILRHSAQQMVWLQTPVPLVGRVRTAPSGTHARPSGRQSVRCVGRHGERTNCACDHMRSLGRAGIALCADTPFRIRRLAAVSWLRHKRTQNKTKTRAPSVQCSKLVHATHASARGTS